jgi:hypothetical protein
MQPCAVCDVQCAAYSGQCAAWAWAWAWAQLAGVEGQVSQRCWKGAVRMQRCSSRWGKRPVREGAPWSSTVKRQASSRVGQRPGARERAAQQSSSSGGVEGGRRAEMETRAADGVGRGREGARRRSGRGSVRSRRGRGDGRCSAASSKLPLCTQATGVELSPRSMAPTSKCSSRASTSKRRERGTSQSTSSSSEQSAVSSR